MGNRKIKIKIWRQNTTRLMMLKYRDLNVIPWQFYSSALEMVLALLCGKETDHEQAFGYEDDLYGLPS